jgi:GMP synthase (glutamine-hydrolysing)
VLDEGSPRAPQAIFADPGHLLRPADDRRAARRQGRGRPCREFGRADVEIVEKESALFDGIWEKGGKYPVWMSHGDRVTRLPPGFTVKASPENAPFAIASDERAASTRPCSTPRSCTRPTARSC